MLCFTMSSIQNWLGFTFKIVSTTILQWTTKATCFCFDFQSILTSFWRRQRPKILMILTPLIDPMDYGHWPKGFSLKILRNSWYRPWAIIEPMLQDRFLIDFEASKTAKDILQKSYWRHCRKSLFIVAYAYLNGQVLLGHVVFLVWFEPMSCFKPSSCMFQ